MLRKFCSLFIFVLAGLVGCACAEEGVDSLVTAVRKLSVEYSEPINEMSWAEKEEALRLLNRIDFISLDLLAIKGAAQSSAYRAAQSYQLNSRNKKAIKKVISLAIKHASKFYDLFDTDLSFFPEEIQVTIKNQEQHLQALYYDTQSIQSVQGALDRIESFHKATQYLIEVSLFHFLRSTYPQMF
ncbi:hypothetical protein JST56_05650 [Candidatus Dependentiae bacterium]|nr:hypothetical protein [Candidatus Dependentiae bacterium]